MAYGGMLNGVANPDVFYVGGGTRITHRVTLGGPITTLSSYPGAAVAALTMDPQNYTHVFVLDQSNQVWSSFDEGSTWINLTANLDTLSNLGTGTDLRTITIFSPDATPKNTVLIAGGQGGVWEMRRPGAAGTTWTPLATGFPHALVYDLSYNYTDNVLTAGTLGRGVWTLTSFFRGGGGTGDSPGGSAPASPDPISFDPGLDLFSAPIALTGNVPQLLVDPSSTDPSFQGGISGLSDGGAFSSTSVDAGAQSDSSIAPLITSWPSFQQRSLFAKNFVGGRGLVNQATDDGGLDFSGSA
jgi:hypothetical protein